MEIDQNCTPLCSDSASLPFSSANKHSKDRFFSAMIAQQRSQSLYDCVTEGAISLDAILAFPIDWQGIAVQQQWSVKAHKQPQPQPQPQLDDIQTRSPLQVKRAMRSRQSRIEALPAHSSSLGLVLNAPTASALSSSPVPTLSDEAHSSCPPSPTLTYSGYTSHSDEESSVSTPDPDAIFASSPHHLTLTKPAYPRLEPYNNTSFPLKSFCSAFNDNDEDEVFTLH